LFETITQSLCIENSTSPHPNQLLLITIEETVESYSPAVNLIVPTFFSTAFAATV
jgi:hypothetical protein